VWGFLIWGGGHAATPDNSLYWLPLDGSGAKRLMGPYLAPARFTTTRIQWDTYRSVSRNAPPNGHRGCGRQVSPHIFEFALYRGQQ